jgi:hypothetical protein
MSKSPLANSFNSKSKKRSKPILILALLGILGLGGGVLAANISINTGLPVEFGQGAAATMTCDTAVQLYPTSTYDESANLFRLTTIEIRKLNQLAPSSGFSGDQQADLGCGNKVLTVKALDSTGAVLVVATAVVPSATATEGTITLTPTPSISSTAIAKLTIESNDNLS